MGFANRSPSGGAVMRARLRTGLQRLQGGHARELKERLGQLAAVIDNVKQGVCLFDGKERLQIWNRRFEELYDLRPGTLQRGLTLAEIVGLRFRAGSAPGTGQAEYLQLCRTVSKDETGYCEVTLGNGRVLAIQSRPMSDGGWVATHEDISARKLVEADVAFLAHHDALTRLPNRTLLHDRLEQALGLVERGMRFAVLCLDLDGFKFVNDSLGHDVGDALLKVVAFRLQACVREADLVARLGGDEFAILQLDIHDAEDVETLARRITAALSEPLDVLGCRVYIGASIGVATAPSDGSSPHTLLTRADLALYIAKSDRRGSTRFFEPAMDEHMRRRRTLEVELRDAVARSEFVVHYQPIVSLQTMSLCGFEALLRWQHPARGLTYPSYFMTVAEQTRLIEPIGIWVLQEACHHAANWPGGIKLTVNMSATELRNPVIVNAIRNVLGASGLEPTRLEIELTETALMQDTPRILAVLETLRGMGVSVALDDFGTGYSSLSHLRSFVFDKIKIDQSFVRDMNERPDAASIVRALAGLGRSLQVKTTAEGVETSDQLEALRGEGCTEAQGFVFGAAVPVDRLPALLARFATAYESASN